MANVRRGLQRLLVATGPEDNVVVHFAGHGSKVESGPDAGTYLAPFDFDPARPGETAIGNEELTGLLSRVKAKQLVLLFDACLSTNKDTSSCPGGAPDFPNEQEAAQHTFPNRRTPTEKFERRPTECVTSSHVTLNPKGIVGLALSGGGIRSSEVQMGLLQTLEERGLLGRMDYVSSVSMGAYISSWLMLQLQRGTRVTEVKQNSHPNSVTIGPRRGLRSFLRGVGSVLDLLPVAPYLPGELGIGVSAARLEVGVHRLMHCHRTH